MIDYFKGIYGINLLFRVHGSALYKGALAGAFSVLAYLAIVVRWNERRDLEEDLDHPYGVGVLVSSVTFLIIIRANYGYQRYWEACGAINHFMSKWMDATMHAAVFHYQNEHYDGARPPNFFDHNGLNELNLTRARKRHGEKRHIAERRLKSVVNIEKEITSDEIDVGGSPSRRKLFNPPSPQPPPCGVLNGYWDVIPPTPEETSTGIRRRTQLNSEHFPSTQRLNGNFASKPNRRTPSLFLQELAHLSSLACAVALSTLRNDIEGSESVLDMYVHGSPWPAIDPDNLPDHIRHTFQHPYHLVTVIRHWLGVDRLPYHRSEYNAARPLHVLGGVSDSEIKFLQRARGPYAKAQMALGWLQEFLIREHVDGSLGGVHAAIISRLVQFLSDGMLSYNHARQIMYIPFPFPHAQLSAFFTVSMTLAVPFLMEQYTNVLWIGSLISFLTVTCLVGLHEVARELENPFRNVPNELPLCTLQARFNETLVTMFSGFNPDSFWDAEMYQGPLEAMKLGKVYQSFSEQRMEKSAVETILEMPTLAESMCQDAATTERSSTDRTTRGSAMRHQSTPEKGKNVSFSANVQTNSDVAKELREVLVKQTLEIEELEKILDGDASNQKSNGIGAIES